MKKIAILANYRDTFFLPEEKRNGYKKLNDIFREYNIELRRVSIHSFDEEKGVFRDFIDIDEGGDFTLFHKEYIPDIVWNRSGSSGLMHTTAMLQRAGFSLFPHPDSIRLASDKYEMSLFFKKYQPKTALLGDFFANKSLQESFGNKLVLKPIRSNSGKGITFPDKQKLLSESSLYEGLGLLFIVQDFKDFSGGIPGIIDGIHDLRLIYIGGEFSCATLRTPKGNGLKSNVGAGGTEHIILKEDITREIWGIAEEVMKNFSFPVENTLFSLDFGYVKSENRWYLLEINYSPGIYTSPEIEDIYHNVYFHSLASFFSGFDSKLGKTI